jgi:hypothetical protein
MSIALMNRIKEMERVIALLNQDQMECALEIAALKLEIEKLREKQNRPKPGRPPKHG